MSRFPAFLREGNWNATTWGKVMNRAVIGKIWRAAPAKPVLWFLAAAAAAACDSATSPAGPSAAKVPVPPVPTPAIEPTRIIKASGDAQEGRPGDKLQQPIVVTVLDAGGRPVTGVQVRFAVVAGDGFIGDVLDWPHSTAASQVTNSNGQALVLWWLGRYGENTVVAGVQLNSSRIEATFHATSVSGGYSAGSFVLQPAGESMELYGDMGDGPYKCVVPAASLTLLSDGSFEGRRLFDFGLQRPTVEVTETGYYAGSDSTIVLHFLKSNDTAGFVAQRDVQGVISRDEITFKDYRVDWRYVRRD